jgi:hypothetical protein
MGWMANKALQATPTARDNFNIDISHNGLVVILAWLPVVRARSGRLKAGVSPLSRNFGNWAVVVPIKCWQLLSKWGAVAAFARAPRTFRGMSKIFQGAPAAEQRILQRSQYSLLVALRATILL